MDDIKEIMKYHIDSNGDLFEYDLLTDKYTRIGHSICYKTIDDKETTDDTSYEDLKKIADKYTTKIQSRKATNTKIITYTIDTSSHNRSSKKIKQYRYCCSYN